MSCSFSNQTSKNLKKTKKTSVHHSLILSYPTHKNFVEKVEREKLSQALLSMRGVLSSNYAKDIQMEKHHYNQGTFITMADMRVRMNMLLQSYLRLHAQSLALT